MTVLRSRDTLSTFGAKSSQPIAMENGFIEPVTPAKTLDFINQSSKVNTPNTSSTSGSTEFGLESGCGSIVVLETGVVRRRSARLGKSLNTRECLENIEVVSGKRKKLESTVVVKSFTGEFDGRNLEKQVLDLELEVEKLERVPDFSTMRLCVQNLGEEVNEMVTDSVEIKDGGSVAKLGLGNEVGILGAETVNNVKQKRKFSTEMNLLGLELGGEDDVEERCLTLRSGKNVVRREIKDNTYCSGNLLGGTDWIKKSEIDSSGDLVKMRSEPSIEECGNSVYVERFAKVEKDKGKVGCETEVISGSVSVNLNLNNGAGAGLLISDSNSDPFYLQKCSDSNESIKVKGASRTETVMKTRGRFNKAQKGKMKVEDKDSSCNDINTADLRIGNDTLLDTVHSAATGALHDGIQARETDVNGNDGRRVYKERFRNIARRVASRFAHFSSQEELGNHSLDVAGREIPLPEAVGGTEDWPGPFSTAMKIMKDRETNKEGQHDFSTDLSEAAEITWIPKRQEQHKCQKQLVPSLQDLCLSILAKNVNAITSLECVPDVLRHKICWFLCDCRRMDSRFLELLVQESPTEICIKDCSWLSEELFAQTFKGCNTSKLTVLQFDQCGSCMPDYVLPATFAHSPSSLPALTTISLKGAYRLSDTGLSMLCSSAPALKSIDLSQCPLLTSFGICTLANSLRLVLRELYIDNCDGIDAMIILPALLDLENLEVLSLAGIQTVSDDFIREVVSVHGCRMKDLVLADCTQLTDSSLEVIGNTCSGLCAIDLTNLCKLTDVAVGHLANGCQEIQKLKFCRSSFSDEAIAAYLDIRGGFLKHLSLNNVIKVSSNTALSLARNCRNLLSLDLSWCRNLTNEALGLIVDSCSSLEVLKLFGCTQVTNVFLEGHSNPRVELIGLKMTPVLKHINVPDFLQGPLRYSSACS